MPVQAVESKEQFDNLKNSTAKLVVVDFYATWCGPCKVIGPKFVTMSDEYGEDIVALKVDVDELEDVAAEAGVSAMPTFMLFKGGEKIDELVGASEEKLRALIVKHK